MGIRKNEFYEGAALHRLLQSGDVEVIRHEHPFFVVNEEVWIYLKYSTRCRSPWAFTFGPEEQALMHEWVDARELIIGLICGSDGIAAVSREDFLAVVRPKGTAIHVSCARKYNQHYAISGPDGELAFKIAPLRWQRILRQRDAYETL